MGPLDNKDEESPTTEEPKDSTELESENNKNSADDIESKVNIKVTNYSPASALKVGLSSINSNLFKIQPLDSASEVRGCTRPFLNHGILADIMIHRLHFSKTKRLSV
jgi:hypothetical protein